MLTWRLQGSIMAALFRGGMLSSKRPRITRMGSNTLCRTIVFKAAFPGFVGVSRITCLRISVSLLHALARRALPRFRHDMWILASLSTSVHVTLLAQACLTSRACYDLLGGHRHIWRITLCSHSRKDRVHVSMHTVQHVAGLKTQLQSLYPVDDDAT